MRTSIDIIRCKNINTFRYSIETFLDLNLLTKEGDWIVKRILEES